MAPAPKPKPKRGVGSRLTAKVGPLPVWAWAAVILGAYLLYSRTHKATTSPSDSTATPDSSGDSGAQVPASGQGSPASNVSADLLDRLNASTDSLDALTSQLLQAAPYPVSADVPLPVDAVPPGAAAQPTTATPSTPTQVGGSVAHATQTAAGVLKWGGLSFTTKAAFDSWAKAHGSSTAAELNNHPQARAIYSTLK